jgi:4-amino-4-deoxy-L-arabinose transferase-like glycosyltransferase
LVSLVGVLRFALLAGVLIALWVPLVPKYLVQFDNANFAWALTQFDPLHHQPQPPGYPLFVVAARLCFAVTRSAEASFLVCGCAAGMSALLLIGALGRRMFGGAAGFAAAALLLVNPAFWASGLTDPVRVFLAAICLGTALPAWFFLTRQTSLRPLYLAFAMLGLLSGFRPESAVFLLPLLLYCGVRGKLRAGHWAVALGLFTVSAGLWLLPTIRASGGPATTWRLVEGYLAAQSHDKSMFFGATAEGAWLMAYKALVWTGIGIISWVWAVRKQSPGGEQIGFLTAWCLPPYLFHSLVHIDDPGHALITVPAVCLLGGWALARFSASRVRFACALAAAIGINAGIFFYPVDPVTEQSSYPHIRSLDQTTSAAIGRIQTLRQDALRKGDSLVIFSAGEPVSWRTLSYYFPGTQIHALLTDLRAHDKQPGAFAIRGRTVLPVTAGAIRLPKCGRIVVVGPGEQLTAQAISAPERFETHGMVWDRAAEPGLELHAGPYRFETGDSCEAAQ